MANYQAVTLKNGEFTRIASADTLVVGAGITTASGNLTIDSAGGTIDINQNLVFASGKSFTLAGPFAQSGGGFAFAGGTNNSSIGTTGSGTLGVTATGAALTITGGASSSWTTLAGVLSVGGFDGLHLSAHGNALLNSDATGTQFTVQAGITFNTTGSGNINLPNNGSSRFKVEGFSVSANVTAANLSTLTAGSSSNADSLHTHLDAGAGSVDVPGLTTTGVTTGLFGYVSSANTVLKTNNTTIGTAVCLGANTGTVGSIRVAGVVSAAAMTSAGGQPVNGATLWLASAADDTGTGAGRLTATAPTSGVLAPIGICLDNSNYIGSKTVSMALNIRPPVVL